MKINRKFGLAVFCVIAFIVSLSLSIDRNGKWGYWHAICWDSEGYYLYLPAVFINHTFRDLLVQNANNDPSIYEFKPYPGTNKTFTKYTYGVALMEMPFFLAAQQYWDHYEKDYPRYYFSAPFMIAIICADCFYLTLGFWLLGLFLLRYFDLRTVVVSEIIIWLGTSLLYYTSYQIGFSHVYSFCLIAALVYLTPRLYEEGRVWHVLLAAAIFGLITVLRPTNIVIGFYLLLYNVYTREQLKQRIALLLRNWIVFPVFGLLGLLAWLPQSLYWHNISGHWLLYSYQGEGFIYWSNPKIFSVLFHPQNGFFLFAPLMLLSMVGLVMCVRRKVFSGWAVLLIFLSTDYISGSWWYWNFGAAYGFRPYIDFMAVLAIPLAYFLNVAARWRVACQIALNACIIFLIYLSCRLQIIYEYPWQGPDWGWKNIVEIHKKALHIK